MNEKILLKEVSSINRKYDTIAELSGDNFNIFKILDVETREEKTHSAIIAELLNPIGSHGKKATFLDLFLQTCCSKNFTLNSNNATVTVEKSTGFINEDYTEGGRIDILIESEGKAIIIENKIYAVDQENQLLRYANYGKQQYNDKYELIYLTLWKEDPSEISLGNKKFAYSKLSYRENILEWLQLCHKEAFDFPMLREAIKQYINLVKSLTNQTMNDNMNNEIVNSILESEDNLKAAISISSGLSAAKEKLAQKFSIKFIEEFKKKRNKEDYNVGNGTSSDKVDIEFTYTSSTLHGISFSLSDRDSDRLHVRVDVLETFKEKTVFINKLDEQIKGTEKWDTVWWKSLENKYAKWMHANEGLLAINEPSEMVNDLLNELIEIDNFIRNHFTDNNK
jgi:hypothetical protein